MNRLLVVLMFVLGSTIPAFAQETINYSNALHFIPPQHLYVPGTCLESEIYQSPPGPSTSSNFYICGKTNNWMLMPSTYQDIASLFGNGACSGFLKSDGTCGSSGGGAGNPGGSANQLQWNSAGAFAGFTMSGDASIVPSTGILTVTGLKGAAIPSLASGHLQYNGTALVWDATSYLSTYPAAGIAVSTGSAWTSSLTAPSSALVGISDSQTLTGKIISGASNTLSNIANASLTNSAITFGSTSVSLGATLTNLNGVNVGPGTPGTGAFTTLAASSTVSGSGFSTYLASPPSIGGTAAAAGTFTTLAATGPLTTNVTGSTQCLQANSSGVVSGTGSACGAGGSGITALTGDVTASGTGSVAATLATVNSNVGTFGSTNLVPVITTNAKGLITAISTASVSGGGAVLPFLTTSPTSSTISVTCQLSPCNARDNDTVSLFSAPGNASISSGTGTITTYRTGSVINVGYNGTIALTCTSGCTAVPSISTTPAGSTLLSTIAVTSGATGTITNSTPVLERDVYTNGTGLTLTTGQFAVDPSVVLESGGALGTPVSGIATNLTGLPLTTGVTGVLPPANGGATHPISTYFSYPATGDLVYVRAPSACTIQGWSIIGGNSVSGVEPTLSFDVWRIANSSGGTSLPLVANSIVTGGTVPTLTAANQVTGATSSWVSTAISANDFLAVQITVTSGVPAFAELVLPCQ